MENSKIYSCSFLIVLLFFPLSINLAHIFAGHHHEVCTHYSDSHFHKSNIECELFEYQRPVYPQIEITVFRFFVPQEKICTSTHKYQFLSELQFFWFHLRGPPERA